LEDVELYAQESVEKLQEFVRTLTNFAEILQGVKTFKQVCCHQKKYAIDRMPRIKFAKAPRVPVT
jgi:hypothetical protein